MKYAFVALLGILLGGVSVWAMRGEAAPASDEAVSEEATPERSAQDEDAPASSRAPTTLAECRQALVRKDVEVRAARATAARAIAKQIFDDDDVPRREPGSDPGAPAPDVRTSATRTPEEREAQRQRWREASTKVHDALVEDLHISPEEESALADVVCPMRENQRSLFLQFSDGNLDPDGLFRALADERVAGNEGMRQALGPERFARIRDIGGFGILARTICRGSQPQPAR